MEQPPAGNSSDVRQGFGAHWPTLVRAESELGCGWLARLSVAWAARPRAETPSWRGRGPIVREKRRGRWVARHGRAEGLRLARFWASIRVARGPMSGWSTGVAARRWSSRRGGRAWGGNQLNELHARDPRLNFAVRRGSRLGSELVTSVPAQEAFPTTTTAWSGANGNGPE